MAVTYQQWSEAMNQDLEMETVALGVASVDTRGSFFRDEDNESGMQPPPGLVEE